RVFDGPDIHGDQVVDVYPVHPLSARAKRSSDEKSDRLRERRKRAVIAHKSNTGPDHNRSNTQFVGGIYRLFFILCNPRQKIRSGGIRLDECMTVDLIKSVIAYSGS